MNRTSNARLMLADLLGPVVGAVALACLVSACAGGESDGAAVESTLAACTDGVDNDGDGFTDCGDQDCLVFAACVDPATSDVGADSVGGDATADVPQQDSSVADSSTDADTGASDSASDADPPLDAGPDDSVAPDGSGPDSTDTGCETDEDCDSLAGWFCVDGACAQADLSPAPDEAQLVEMGVLDGFGAAGETQAIGSVIDTFCGIDAYQNGPSFEHVENYGTFGYEYQCTELAYRFICEHYGLCKKKEGAYGNAKAWYGNTTHPVLGKLTRYPSGGKVAPQPGDVLVFGSGKYGHVAIVKDVIEAGDGTGVVVVLEQNVHAGSHRYALSIAGGNYSIGGALGWMRLPGAAPACGVGGTIDAVSVSANTLQVSGGASAAAGVQKIALTIDGGAEVYTQTYSGSPATATYAASVNLNSNTSLGYHPLTLWVTAVGGEAYEAASSAFVYAPDGTHPYLQYFQQASAEFGVPACLLMAIGHVESGWNQAAVSPDGGYGVMQLTGGTLLTAAALIGASPAAVKANSSAGAQANIRAAAALLADWADDTVGGVPLMFADDPINALESWWFVVVRYNGGGLDGSLLTSNYVYRVFNKLAFGVPPLFPGVGIDLTSVPPVQGSRPATPNEISLGEVNSTDHLLVPTVPKWHLRTFQGFDVADLPTRHDCSGVCATAACDGDACAPEAYAACSSGSLYWYDSCDVKGGLSKSCDDGNACTSNSCAEGACVNLKLSDGTACGSGKVCAAGSCGCAPNAEKKCADGNVYWFDSCGVKGSVVEDCNDANPCTTDTCSAAACSHATMANGSFCGPDKVCQAGACDCTPAATKKCAGGKLYNYDSCGNQGPLSDACDDGSPCTADGCSGAACTHAAAFDGSPCGGGKVCDGGSCGCSAQSYKACSGGAVYWFDSCDAKGAIADSCDDGNPCTSDGCSGSACTHPNAANGTVCGSGLECSAGTCQNACIDNDKDGFFSNCAPFDCSGHDNDKYIYPNAPEVWDVRDNDCDGTSDELGRVRYDRYFRAWSGSDWEHRFAQASPGSGWTSDSHFIELYPTNVCSGQYAPLDGCFVKSGGTIVEMWGGFVLVALSRCTGTLAGGAHLSLLLSEDGGEYTDYAGLAGFTCTRLGFTPGPAAGVSASGTTRLYRHRSGFSASAKSDNMWSTNPTEGAPDYDVHEPSHYVLGGF
jgi:surface antigen